MSSKRVLVQTIESQVASLIEAIVRTRAAHSRFLEWAAEQETATLAAAKHEAQQSLQAAKTEADQTSASAAHAHATRLAELDTWRDQTLRDAADRRSRLVVEADGEHERVYARTEEQHQTAMKAARAAFEAALAEAHEEHQRRRTQSQATFDVAMAAGQYAYEAALSKVLSSAQAVETAAALSAADSADPAWRHFKPGGDNHHPPTVTRLGRFGELGPWGPLQAPALLPVVGSRGVLVTAPARRRIDAVLAIQSLLLRLLATLPPGKLRFTFLDPIGLGQNAAAFMHLADYDDTLVTARAWTEPQHIEQRLADLTEHMENVIQKYLRNQYPTIEDYNAQAGEVAEPYRVLVVFDFPANFSEAAARRLVSIAQNGPRCGVYTVVLADTERVQATGQAYGGAAGRSPIQLALADLEQACTVIAWQEERWVWQDPDFQDCLLELDTPPETALFNRIITAVGEAAKDAGRVEVPFQRIAPPPAQWWTGDSRRGLRVPLGPSGARKVQFLDLGSGTAQHALVAGKTGAGKSTLLHTLITSLGLTYSPDEVQLYLIDFKKGVEFKPYAASALPHARVVAIESEREFGLSVLQGLDVELKRRGDLFRKAGVDSIADYRARLPSPVGGRGAGGEGLPRILLLVDEFQEFFTIDDPTASQASQILDRLVRQGRAFGIHVLLGSQTLAGAYSLARSTVDQMAVRIALQCSEADSRLILADDNPAARLLSRPGEAIYNAANGLVEGNNRFQVAWLPDEERDAYLARIATLAEERNYQPARPQIIFEGNAPAEIEKNQPLHNLLSHSPLLPGEGAGVRLKPVAYLGDPIAIKEPTAVAFRRQSASNLSIVGQQDEAALGMLAAALFSLAAQHPATGPGSAQFTVLDFSPADAPHAGLLRRLVEALPHPARWGQRRQVPDLIAELADAVADRLAADDSLLTELPSRYLLIYGVQRARDLRPDEDMGFSSFARPGEEPAPSSPARQFPTILRDGPEVGIHTLIWCDTYANLLRTLDRRLLREFDLRVAFQMSAEDSANLLDTPAAAKLGLHRALLYSEEDGRLEKLRPYGPPTEAWLAWALSRLQGQGRENG